MAGSWGLKTLLAVASFSAYSAIQAQDLLIGQVASQTSPIVGASAKGMAIGLKAYFDYANAKGGIAGRPVKLVTKDDDFVADRMIKITNEFIAERSVLALAGYINTTGLTQLSQSGLLGESRIALISPLQGDKSVVSTANIFPFRSGYSEEVTALVHEAKKTFKTRVAVVSWNITFGPEMAKLVKKTGSELGLNIANWTEIDAKMPDNFEAVMARATEEVIAQSPDAIIMLIAGRYALDFIKRIKNSRAKSVQLYAMSIVASGDVVKTVGEAQARGLVIAQAVPHPFSPTRPLVSEYQAVMQRHAPGEPFSFSTLEGFVAAKITVEALKRAGPNPTREGVLKALNTMGEFNLGGVYVNYSSAARRGWGSIDLTMIDSEGKLVR